LKCDISLSIGIDIEEVTAFSNRKYEKKKSLYKKIFTPTEINYCLKKSNPYPHFTARFCVKEAAIKAMKNKRFKLTDIEIKIKRGKPILKLPNGERGIVSLSHTKKYATAVVIVL